MIYLSLIHWHGWAHSPRRQSKPSLGGLLHFFGIHGIFLDHSWAYASTSRHSDDSSRNPPSRTYLVNAECYLLAAIFNSHPFAGRFLPRLAGRTAQARIICDFLETIMPRMTGTTACPSAKAISSSAVVQNHQFTDSNSGQLLARLFGAVELRPLQFGGVNGIFARNMRARTAARRDVLRPNAFRPECQV